MLILSRFGNPGTNQSPPVDQFPKIPVIRTSSYLLQSFSSSSLFSLLFFNNSTFLLPRASIHSFQVRFNRIETFHFIFDIDGRSTACPSIPSLVLFVPALTDTSFQQPDLSSSVFSEELSRTNHHDAIPRRPDRHCYRHRRGRPARLQHGPGVLPSRTLSHNLESIHIFGGFTTNGCYRAATTALTSPSPTPTAAPAVLLSSVMKAA